MLSDFLYSKVFLHELQSFIALFIGEEKKLALRFPASPNKRPPSPQPPVSPQCSLFRQLCTSAIVLVCEQVLLEEKLADV